MVFSGCTKTISRTALSLSLLLLASTGAFASNATVTAMGMESDTYWMIQHDESYMTLNPVALSKMNQEIFLNPINELGGIIISPKAPLNILVTTGQKIQSKTFAGWTAASAQTELQKEGLNVTASYEYRKMTFGAGLAYASKSKEDSTLGTTNSFDDTLIKARLGFMMDINSTMNVDASLGIDSWSKEVKAAGTKTYEANPLDYVLLGRFNMQMSEISKLHVFAGYSSVDRTEKVSGVKAKDESSNMFLGVSDEMTLTKSTTVYAGALFSKGSENMGSAVDTMKLKVAGGISTSLTDSLSLRFGANRVWYDNTSYTRYDQTKEDPTTNCTMGLGYKIGNVDFDWQVQYGLFANGPYLISGKTQTSANFEVTYYFETGSQKARK